MAGMMFGPMRSSQHVSQLPLLLGELFETASAKYGRPKLRNSVACDRVTRVTRTAHNVYLRIGTSSYHGGGGTLYLTVDFGRPASVPTPLELSVNILNEN